MEILLEALGNIGFDWRMALANLVNFLIIFFLLKKFVWQSLRTTLDERKTKIEKGIQDAEDAQMMHQNAEKEYHNTLKEAAKEAFSIVGGAHTEGKEIVASAREKAFQEEISIREEGKALLAKEHEDMKKAFQEEAIELVMSGVEKVVKEKMTKEKDEAFIRSALKQ